MHSALPSPRSTRLGSTTQNKTALFANESHSNQRGPRQRPPRDPATLTPADASTRDTGLQQRSSCRYHRPACITLLKALVQKCKRRQLPRWRLLLFPRLPLPPSHHLQSSTPPPPRPPNASGKPAGHPHRLPKHLLPLLLEPRRSAVERQHRLLSCSRIRREARSKRSDYFRFSAFVRPFQAGFLCLHDDDNLSHEPGALDQ